jgi:hypothetical protein
MHRSVFGCVMKRMLCSACCHALHCMRRFSKTYLRNLTAVFFSYSKGPAGQRLDRPKGTVVPSIYVSTYLAVDFKIFVLSFIALQAHIYLITNSFEVGRRKEAALLIFLRVRLSHEKNPPKCRVPRPLKLKRVHSDLERKPAVVPALHNSNYSSEKQKYLLTSQATGN